MARDLEQPYDPFEASLHELRGALVDLDGDGRPDATMPIPPGVKAIQYIDDKLAPHFPDESRSGNAMQVAQGGPVMTDGGLTAEDMWANVPQTRTERHPEAAPQQNAMMQYLSNTGEMLSQIPDDLASLFRGGPLEIVGNVAGALPPVLTGAAGAGLYNGFVRNVARNPRVLAPEAQRVGRSLTPSGRTTNALDDVTEANAMLRGRLQEAGRPVPLSSQVPARGTPKEMLAAERAARDDLYRSVDAMDETVRGSREAVEQARQTPYSRTRDERGRFVSKAREEQILNQRARQAEVGTGQPWKTSEVFSGAENIRGFNEAVAAKNYDRAAELVSRQTGAPVDAVRSTIVDWLRRSRR